MTALEEQEQFRQDTTMAAETCEASKSLWEKYRETIGAATGAGRPVMFGNFANVQPQAHNE